ncbi:unnamed protein product [Amoebophrya sp. A120]|nr:unnamed protein product [Amoebophrya sp. A120]|eukprot:GSA120T00021052001.1
MVIRPNLKILRSVSTKQEYYLQPRLVKPALIFAPLEQTCNLLKLFHIGRMIIR